MTSIPPVLEEAFRLEMQEMALLPKRQREWLKWLRYYLDFCLKNGRNPRGQDNETAFMSKLASKGQTEAQRSDAAACLVVFFRIVPRFGGPKQAGAEVGGAKRTGPQAGGEGFTERSAAWADAFTGLDEKMALRQLARTTRKTYRGYIRQFRWFMGLRGPEEADSDAAVAFLTHLAVERNVTASTQNQAFNALLFLYRHVFERTYELEDRVVRARKVKYVPQILSRQEIDNLTMLMPYPNSLMGKLLYGCGLRLNECLTLRVQNFDFDLMTLTVRQAKGRKDRVVPLPESICEELKEHLGKVCHLHDLDMEAGYAGAIMPEDGAVSTWQAREKDVGWQFFFPGKDLFWVESEKAWRRGHQHSTWFGKVLRTAVRRLRITKRVTAHTFRHSFASHLLMANYDIRTVQVMLGHSDVKTTMIYTQTVPSRTLKERRSPLDFEAGT